MPSRSEVQPARSEPRSARSGLRSSHGEIRIFSDFDDTIIPVNAGVRLARSYLWTGKGSILGRVRRVVRLRRILSSTMMDRYYRVLRSMPAEQRRQVLAGIPVSRRWLDAVQDIRFAHRARTVRLTIVSRNCIDVIDDWLVAHERELAQRGIVVEMIIANKPIADGRGEFVRERFKHIDRAGLGTLDVEHKREFLPADAIYLGDYDEEVLSDQVREFVRV